MNYGVYISGKGTRIKKALEQNIELLGTICVVISDSAENVYLKDFFEEKGIKYYLIDFKSINAENRHIALSDGILEILKNNEIDYCFSFGAHILKGRLLEEYKWKIINFHPALLPQFPGVNAIDKAVEANARFIGNTAHFIDKGVDTGPIILQSVTLVDNFIRNGYDAVMDEQIAMLYEIDHLLVNDKIHIKDKKVQIDGADYEVTYCFPKIK